MESNLLWLNGLDAADLGFTLIDAPDLLGGGARTPQTVQVPQAAGVLLSSAPVSVAPRIVRLLGYCEGSTLANARLVHDRIASQVGSGLVEIRTGWASSRVMRGVLVTRAAGPNSAAWLGQIRVELEFLCADPYAYAPTPFVFGFASTPTEMQFGTKPSVGRDHWSAIITIAGAATTPTLTEYDATGTALRTMVWTSSPGANDAIEIDLGRGLVTNIASGVRTNGYASLTAGFEFPRLDPAEGDWYTGAFPQLAVSSGTATIRYFQAFG